MIGFSVLVLAAGVSLLLYLTGAGEERKEENNNLYGNVIAGLGDEEQFSLEDIGEENNVLFTTDMTYDACESQKR